MIASLAIVVVLGSLALAGAAIVRGVRRRAPGRTARLATVLLEVAAVAQAAHDAAGLVAGHRPADPAVHVGYLMCSVAVVPVVAAVVRRDRGPIGAGATAFGLVALAVVVVRMQQTWFAAHA